MSVEATSALLATLAAARRSSDHEIESAISELRAAYKHIVEAAEVSAALNFGVGKSSSTPMTELEDYLATTREALAEITMVLIELHPKQAGNLGVNPSPASFATDARNGMQVKRLAKWEAEALRTVVVEALAGDAKASQ